MCQSTWMTVPSLVLTLNAPLYQRVRGAVRGEKTCRGQKDAALSPSLRDTPARFDRTRRQSGVSKRRQPAKGAGARGRRKRRRRRRVSPSISLVSQNEDFWYPGHPMPSVFVRFLIRRLLGSERTGARMSPCHPPLLRLLLLLCVLLFFPHVSCGQVGSSCSDIARRCPNAPVCVCSPLCFDVPRSPLASSMHCRAAEWHVQSPYAEHQRHH